MFFCFNTPNLFLTLIPNNCWKPSQYTLKTHKFLKLPNTAPLSIFKTVRFSAFPHPCLFIQSPPLPSKLATSLKFIYVSLNVYWNYLFNYLFIYLIDAWTDMNITKSLKKWLSQYLQKEYQQTMLLWTSVNKLYVFSKRC